MASATRTKTPTAKPRKGTKKSKAASLPAGAKPRPDRSRFVAEYLIDLNATEAAKRCGYSPKTAKVQGSRLLTCADIAADVEKAKKARIERTLVKADDVLARWLRRAAATAEDFLTQRTIQRRSRMWITIAEAAQRKRDELAMEREYGLRVALGDKELKGHELTLKAMEREAVRLELRAERDPGYMVEVEGPLETVVVEEFDLVRMREAGRLDLVKLVQRDREGGVKVQLHDAAQADEALARHLGLFNDKLKVEVGDLAKKTDAELEAEAKALGLA
jgi:phage terminase small subunit